MRANGPSIEERRSASSVGNRIILYDGFIDGHVVSEAIGVFLDTFPFPGRHACLEAQALATRYGDMTEQATLVEQHLRAAWADVVH